MSHPWTFLLCFSFPMCSVWPSFCLLLIVSLCSGVSSYYPHLHSPYKLHSVQYFFIQSRRSTWSHKIPCNDHGPLTPNLWGHHGIAKNSVMGSQKRYQCKSVTDISRGPRTDPLCCHQRDTGNFIFIIKLYIGYQHCHYCIYVGVWFFNVNSHNSFIYITLHIYEHVTQPLPLNLPFTFTFSHLADAFIQSDLQLGNT